MRVFAAGIATETNTFSSLPTGLEDFQIQRGKAVARGQIDYPSLDLHELWGKEVVARGHEFVFSLMAWAQPLGKTLRSAYETLRDEILQDLEAALPVDVVLLNLHGAMIAEGYEDCEEDLMRRVRVLVGPHAVIAVELDLHCHLNELKIAAADIVITYKEYPHVDINARAAELLELAFRARDRQIRPTMALFECRMIGAYPTSREPMRGFVDALHEAERRDGVLSVSFAHGFQFADHPHVGAKVLVVTDNDRALAEQVAREFGLNVHGLRRQIGFESLSLPMEAALSSALASRNTPVVVADQSDNVGGGAPGDATFALRWLLDHQVHDVGIAILYDPEVVKIARKVGQGGRLSVRLGGKLGPNSGDPVDIEVEVLSLIDDYMHVWPQSSGAPLRFPIGTVAALRCGSIDVIVSSERCQCLSPSIFTDLEIDPRSKRLLIAKSNQHFYNAFAEITKEVIYMSAPGAVPPDPRRSFYRRLDTTRLYPWNENPFAS